MTTTNGNRKLLDIPRWELLSLSPQTVNAGDSICVSPIQSNKFVFRLMTTSYNIGLYDAETDSWVSVKATGNIGTKGAGSAIWVDCRGTSGTVSSGTTTTVTIDAIAVRNLEGFYIFITSGNAAGEVRKIKSNDPGTINTVITVETAFSSAPALNDGYVLFTPVVYTVSANSTATASFRKYDWATDTLTTLSNLPAAFTGHVSITGTPSFIGNDWKSFGSGTASSGGASTLTDSSKNWATNQWTNSKIIITAGTGKGQERSISSNTATAITVSTNWTTNPDNTSVYKVCGNDDYLYVTGNASTAFYRYSKSGNSWSTSPTGVATRPSAATNPDLSWAINVEGDVWNTENTIRNGRYFYSRRSSAANPVVIDKYDIAANSWSSITTIGNDNTAAIAPFYYKNDIIMLDNNDPRRVIIFDIKENNIRGGLPILPTTTLTANQAASTGFVTSYIDGATQLDFIYLMAGTTAQLYRIMTI